MEYNFPIFFFLSNNQFERIVFQKWYSDFNFTWINCNFKKKKKKKKTSNDSIPINFKNISRKPITKSIIFLTG